MSGCVVCYNPTTRPPVCHDPHCDAASRCPACGDLPDYCQGHGAIGDPAGAAILAAHDDGDHAGCVVDCDTVDLPSGLWG